MCMNQNVIQYKSTRVVYFHVLSLLMFDTPKTLNLFIDIIVGILWHHIAYFDQTQKLNKEQTLFFLPSEGTRCASETGKVLQKNRDLSGNKQHERLKNVGWCLSKLLT